MPDPRSQVDVALHADRELAAEASELLPDGFIAVMADGMIDYVNGRAAAICGLPAEDLAGRDIREMLALQDLQGNNWWDASEQARRLTISTGHREKMLVLPNGRFVLLTARYLRHPDGTLFSALLGLRDAAERMRSERQMAELITTVAHELKSPIASITGFTGSLLRHWDRFADDDKRVMLRTVQEDAARVTRLVSDLLDVTRIESRSLTVRPGPIDIGEVFEAQVARRVARGESLDRFAVEVEDGLPELWADADRFEQVITNLVDNARKHGEGRVCLRADPAELPSGNPAVRICVCDEGQGIPPEDRELVFSRYWQGGSKAGSGLGLFIVRGIIEAHGGVVELGSSEAGGARIEILLPAGQPAHLA